MTTGTDYKNFFAKNATRCAKFEEVSARQIWQIIGKRISRLIARLREEAKACQDSDESVRVPVESNKGKSTEIRRIGETRKTNNKRTLNNKDGSGRNTTIKRFEKRPKLQKKF